MWRAERLYPDTEIVSRTHEGRTRHTYAEYADRTARLANALDAHGIERGDRVATFCWNHTRHFETYFGVPNTGAQLHTINPLLPDEHIRYIVDDADDEIVFVDPSLAEKIASAAGGAAEFEGIDFVVMGASEIDALDAPAYEEFISDRSTEYDWPDLDGDQPAGLCYTSGTTGKPKGVEYTQSMLWSHTMASQTPQGIPMEDSDVVMPVVPMFHVNAWGMPFTATAAGAKHVYPGPSPDPADLAALIEEEGVTVSAGVPTVWLGLREYVEGGNEVDLSTLDTVIIGGAAAPRALIEWYDERDVEVLHAWGMTELSPIGTVSHLKHDLRETDYETRVKKRSKQGLVAPGLEFEVIDEDGEEVPWNGEDFGELRIRGPWVTKEYFKRPEANEAEFVDGWLKTGDVVTVDEDGYMRLVDRTKDVIKSGGEWISSVELENAIMAYGGVSEAAVVGVPHERWQERPVAFVVVTDGVDREELVERIETGLREEYPEWWVPDAVEFIDEVPKTATGKFSKKDLRERYGDQSLVEGAVPEADAPQEE